MNNQIIIVGAFHEIIELVEESCFEIIGLIDNIKTTSYLGYKILCSDTEIESLLEEYLNIPLLITPDSPKVRNNLYLHYSKLAFNFETVISKSAKISKSAFIGNGTIIQYDVFVSSGVKIGKFVKLNTKCNIMHDSIIGDFTTIAPNAVILGNVKIGNNCYIGANATILPNISICDDVIIGAGAVVTKDINIPKVFAGIPAKLI